MGISTKENSKVLKLMHPGRYVEIFRQPITVGEIMRKYPRHCISRPDVFQFPWIVVSPESVLFPGNVFYLMPYRTLDKLLKNKTGCYSVQNSMAGLTPKHQEYLIQEERDNYDVGNLYKQGFYKSWNKMRRNLHQPQDQESYDDHSGLIDSSHIISGGKSCFSHSMNVKCVWPRVNTNLEEHDVIRPRYSCLRKPDSVRKKMNLKVTFACRRGSPEMSVQLG